MKPCSQFNAAEWLHYLESRHQEEIQLGLSRIEKVADSLGLRQTQAKVITVAGTNGKGSTVATLESIYLAAGYQVASYTSPHLLDFNERIRINRKPISDAQLCQAFTVIEEARGQTHLTYFEMATLAALLYFKQKNPELIILEVGLGGRQDATNMIDADLSIITTIDLDHQEFLGDNIEAIAFEKAGILRPGKPFIFADKNPPHSIVEQAQALNTENYYQGKEFSCKPKGQYLEFEFQNERLLIPRPILHCNSVSAAIMASFCLQKELPLGALQRLAGLKDLALAGRLQISKGEYDTVFDVSHNPQAVNYLAEFIKNLNHKGRIHAVFSAVKDKDLPGLIRPLRTCVDYWYPALLSGKRAATAEQLTDAFAASGHLNPVYHSDPLVAYQTACNQAQAGDLIVVYGSFITVGKVMSAVYNSCKTKETE